MMMSATNRLTFKLLLRAFIADQQLDVACFKIATLPGEPEYKDYFPQPYSLNMTKATITSPQLK
jgi:hypothetical protein